MFKSTEEKRDTKELDPISLFAKYDKSGNSMIIYNCNFNYNNQNYIVSKWLYDELFHLFELSLFNSGSCLTGILLLSLSKAISLFKYSNSHL